MEKQKQSSAQNALWRIRNELNIPIKQVAKVMGYKSPDIVERYEKGTNPNLQNTIKLMLIYRSNLSELFPELYNECQIEVSKNLQKYLPLIDLKARNKIRENIQFCTYERILDKVPFTSDDHNFIRTHLNSIMNRLTGSSH